MQKGRAIIPLAIVAVGIVFIVIGVLGGDASDVLQKSVRICLECVGIG